MRTLDAAAVRAATPWPELIAAVADVLAADGVSAPERHVHPVGLPDGGAGSLLLMPAWEDGEVIGVKTVTYFPSNAGTSAPSVNAVYVLFDGRTGEPRAVLDGGELTDRRTAAVSALAASCLARTDAERLLVVGTGRLSPNMARAHAAVRPLSGIEIWGRRPEAAASVAEQLRAEGLPAEASADLDASIGRADVVSCVTGATSPLVRGELLAPGTHLDLVGSFRPEMRESDNAAAARATIFVDTAAGRLDVGRPGPAASGRHDHRGIDHRRSEGHSRRRPPRPHVRRPDHPVQVRRLRSRRPSHRPPNPALIRLSARNLS